MSDKSARVLKEFLQQNRITKSEFCRVADISRFSLYKYLAGGNIHPKAAKKIEQNILETFRIFLPHEKLID